MIDPIFFLQQTINFLLLMVLLRWLLYKPVRAFLDERTASIEEQINNAKEQQVAAEKLRSELQERLEVGKQTAQEYMDQAIREAERRSKEIHDDFVAKAKAEVETMQTRAQADLTREKEKAWQELKANVVQFSFDIASKVVQASIDQKQHRKLIQEVTSKLDQQKLSNDH